MKNSITLNDEQAVQLFINGDSRGIEILIERHKARIFSSIYVLVKDKSVAEDIFQDLFIKIIENLRVDNYKEENKFINWAIRIAHNMCIDHFRKMKSRPVIRTSDDKDIFDVLNFEGDNAEQAIMKTQTHKRVMALVNMLPKDQREVIILRHFADLKFKEIAGILQCSVNTALGRMRYGLLNLRKLMEEKQLAL